MNYAQIRQFDVANGEGIRTSFFVTGCTHCCEGCFNEVYQDFKYGQPWTENETELILSHLSHPMVKGLTILGGEPFQNVEGLLPVLQKIKQESPKTIWIYSGYTFEQLCSDVDKKELLSLCDVLVDGPFILEKRDLTLRFRGSSNQRILDIQKSLISNQPVEYVLAE